MLMNVAQTRPGVLDGRQQLVGRNGNRKLSDTERTILLGLGIGGPVAYQPVVALDYNHGGVVTGCIRPGHPVAVVGDHAAMVADEKPGNSRPAGTAPIQKRLRTTGGKEGNFGRRGFVLPDRAVDHRLPHAVDIASGGQELMVGEVWRQNGNPQGATFIVIDVGRLVTA
jgi:hypothetical protein